MKPRLMTFNPKTSLVENFIEQYKSYIRVQYEREDDILKIKSIYEKHGIDPTKPLHLLDQAHNTQ